MAETVVLDSSNIAAIIADATGEPLEPPKEEAQPDPKAETKADERAPEKEDEDDNGLTEAEKRELTLKMQRAVGKKHRQMREAQEESARARADRLAAERRAEVAERELQELRSASAPKEDGPKEPQRKDFETDAAYHDALFDHRVKERVKAELQAEREAAEKKAQEAEMERIRTTAAERIKRAMELVPDYREVIEAADINVPPYIAAYMQESELFAEIGYYFVKHQDVLERLSGLKPGRALVELGKIEATIQPFAASSTKTAAKDDKPNGSAEPSTTGESPSRPRVSAPVIRPLNTRGAPQVEKPESEMDPVEARKAWEKRNGANLSRRQRH